MALLMQFPAEIIHDILSSCSPDDLVSFGLASHQTRDFVHHNTALYRSVYRSHFVRPVSHSICVAAMFEPSNICGQDVPPTKELDWVREIQDYLRLKSICASENPAKVQVEIPIS